MGAEAITVLRRGPGSGRDRARGPLIAGTWLYFALLILLPVVWMLKEAAAQGPALFLRQLSRPEALHAFGLTALLTIGAVVLNTCFGVVVAVVLVRQRFRGRSLLNALVDLPFALSPVIAGYMLILLFGQGGWLAPGVERLGLKVAFALPGMLLATVFVTLPFVIREVGPVLAAVGREQDEAAYTLGAGRLYTFWRITLPSIKWGLLYGVTLTIARAIGEFGAVLVISGNIIGRTQTATLLIHQACVDFDPNAAFAAATVLALVSFLVLIASEIIRARAEVAPAEARSSSASPHTDTPSGPDEGTPSTHHD